MLSPFEAPAAFVHCPLSELPAGMRGWFGSYLHPRFSELASTGAPGQKYPTASFRTVAATLEA
jgi:hypothetical protein